MTRTQILQWLTNEFAPLTLATPTETLMQQVENAIKYWNTHSAYKHPKMYNYASAVAPRIQLDPDIQAVANVYPAQETTWVLQDYPLWTLVGIQVLDNVTSDLIVMTEAYRNYRFYTGTDFRWHYERSEDPTQGGYLYTINMPLAVTRVCVVGTKRIMPDEDITSEHICNWLQYYAKALVKMIEGNTLRKSGLINVNNDGDQLVREGKEEMKELQDQLAKEGRWFTFVRRS